MALLRVVPWFGLVSFPCRSVKTSSMVWFGQLPLSFCSDWFHGFVWSLTLVWFGQPLFVSVQQFHGMVWFVQDTVVWFGQLLFGILSWISFN